MWKAYQDDVILAHQTDDLSDSQPAKGIIEGELTTIEEKALGNLEEIVRRTSNGGNTIADALGHREFSMTKIYRSAEQDR